MKRAINKKRLGIEIAIIGTIVLGVILWAFLPWFFVQPVPATDPYEQYKILYNKVIGYDFSKGPSSDLERRLNHALESYEDSFRRYYNLKARIEYNYRLGNNSKAIEDLKEAMNYAPTEDESTYVYDLYQKLTAENSWEIYSASV